MNWSLVEMVLVGQGGQQSVCEAHMNPRHPQRLCTRSSGVACSQNFSSQQIEKGRSRVQGHLRPHIRAEDILGYVDHTAKRKRKKTENKPSHIFYRFMVLIST